MDSNHDTLIQAINAEDANLLRLYLREQDHDINLPIYPPGYLGNQPRLPLQIALGTRWVEGVSILLEHGANLNGESVIMAVINDMKTADLPKAGKQVDDYTIQLMDMFELALRYESPTEHHVWEATSPKIMSTIKPFLLEALFTQGAPWPAPRAGNTFGVRATQRAIARGELAKQIKYLANFGPIYTETAHPDQKQSAIWIQMMLDDANFSKMDEELLDLLIDNGAHSPNHCPPKQLVKDAYILLSGKPALGCKFIAHASFPKEGVDMANKNTLLCETITNSNPNILKGIRAMLDAGADPNGLVEINGDEITPLFQVIRTSRFAVKDNIPLLVKAAQLLISQGADPGMEVQGQRIVDIAIEVAVSPAILQVILNSPVHVNPISSRGLSLLPEESRKLLQAKIDLQNMEARTAVAPGKSKTTPRL